MTRMILYTSQFLDQGCNARERPQVGLVTTADRTRHQGLDHLCGLIGGQLGLTTGLSFAGKPRLTAFGPCLLPSVGDLPGYSESSADFRSGNVLLEEGSGPYPSFFHLNMVTLRWHDPTITRGLRYVTLFRESQ